jgi:hypothetical protein
MFNYAGTSLTEVFVLVYFCIYLPDDDLIEVETCSRDMGDMIIYYLLQNLLF